MTEQRTVSRCPICGSNNRKREQKLIDIMFDVAMRIRAGEFGDASRECVAAWISAQLGECGFTTRPQGLSWGVLQ
jgi:hypothetical protein